MIKQPFDKVSHQYDSFMHFRNLYKIPEFISLLNLSWNEIIADIGGGTGYIAKALSPYCRTIYIVDQSPAMLSKVKNSKHIIPFCRDACATGFQSSYFDVIILSDVLHHIEDHSSLLKEMKRICKPGGFLLIQDFDISFIKTRIPRFFEGLLFGKLFFHTRIYFDTLIEQAGFIKNKELPTNFNFIQTWQKKISA